MGLLQPGLPPINPHEGLGQADLPGADRLDFAALQGDPGFQPFEQEVLVAGFAIGGDNFDSGFHRFDSILAQFMTQRVITWMKFGSSGFAGENAIVWVNWGPAPPH